MTFLLSRRWVLFAVAVALMAWCAVRLGEWQFSRLEEREQRNEWTERNLAAAPAPVEAVLAVGQPVPADREWTRVTVTGEYDADETVEGGEHLSLAGLEIDVHFTPGHSPGHVTYATEGALFSGDVLFQGSVGRTDLPGGDWPTLARSIQSLLDAHPDDTRVFPGHMGLTTLGQERATNPFLHELA